MFGSVLSTAFLLFKLNAQIIMRLRKVIVQRDGLPKRCLRLEQTAGFGKQDAYVEPGGIRHGQCGILEPGAIKSDGIKTLIRGDQFFGCQDDLQQAPACRSQQGRSGLQSRVFRFSTSCFNGCGPNQALGLQFYSFVNAINAFPQPSLYTAFGWHRDGANRGDFSLQ